MRASPAVPPTAPPAMAPMFGPGLGVGVDVAIEGNGVGEFVPDVLVEAVLTLSV